MKLPERLPNRLPLFLFGVLALASVFAFYITQHLKVQNPLINGDPRADPAVINPRDAGVCLDEAKHEVSFKRTQVAFYLQSKSDTVIVNVINAEGTPVATMRGSGRHIRARFRHYAYFSWNGRTGGGYAPDGVYTFRVTLVHQDRTFPISGVSVRVQSGRPRPRVSSITVDQGAGTTTPVGPGATTVTTATSTSTASTTTTTSATVSSPTTTVVSTSHGVVTTASATTTTATVPTTPTFTPDLQHITIHFAKRKDIGADVLVYRANPDGTLTLVKSFGANPRSGMAVWDGMIKNRPAPAGSYLVGLSVVDSSCAKGVFPQETDPAPGSTAGAGVNVSYLGATPPLDPVPAGQDATVAVQSGGAPYQWALRLAGQSKVLEHGRSTGAAQVRVKLPDIGLYEFTVASVDHDAHRTSVPLVASGVGARAHAKVLVILPALSWQGANAVDGNSDGLIDSLADGGQVNLDRPLVGGLPADFNDEAGLLNFLDSEHLSYDLTTDVALAEGVGPNLAGRGGALLDGTFTWLPSEIVHPLTGYVKAGGTVFAAGLRSLQQEASITGSGSDAVAGPAQPMRRDPFGVSHGTISSTAGELITELTDQLRILTDFAAFSASQYQILDPPGGKVASAAGVSDANPTVVGFHLGHGTVVEAGLPDFGTELGRDVDARQFLARVYQVLLNK